MWGLPYHLSQDPLPSKEEDQVLIDTKSPSSASTLLLSSPTRVPPPHE